MLSIITGFISRRGVNFYGSIVILLICGSAYGYHWFTVKQMEAIRCTLQNNVKRLEDEKADLQTAINSLETANSTQSDTINKLLKEAEISKEIRKSLQSKIYDANIAYDTLLASTSGQEDARISPRLLSILNNINGIKESDEE